MKNYINGEENLSYNTSTEILLAIARFANVDIDDIVEAHKIGESDLSEYPELEKELREFNDLWADGEEKTEEIIKLAWEYAGEETDKLFWGDTHTRKEEPKIKAEPLSNISVEVFENSSTEMIMEYIEKNKISNIVTYDGEPDDRAWVFEGIRAWFGIEDIMIYPETILSECIDTITDRDGVTWCDMNQVCRDFEKLFLK